MGLEWVQSGIKVTFTPGVWCEHQEIAVNTLTVSSQSNGRCSVSTLALIDTSVTVKGYLRKVMKPNTTI